MRIEIDVDNKEVSALFKQISSRVADLTPLMNISGEIIRSSVIENFRVGGRPEKWKPSKRAILQDGQTLVDKGILRNSINYQAGRNRVEVGTNVVYAAIHQFGLQQSVNVKQHKRKNKKGGASTVKAHSRKINMPKRPFLLVQDEDLEEIREAALEYLI